MVHVREYITTIPLYQLEKKFNCFTSYNWGPEWRGDSSWLEDVQRDYKHGGREGGHFTSLGRKGVSAPGGCVCPIYSAMGRVDNIVDSISALQQYYWVVKDAKKCYKYGGIQNSDFSTYFCFYSNLIFNNLRCMRPFLSFQLWPSALEYIKQMTKINSFVNQLRSWLIQKYFFPVFQLRC